MTLKAAAKINWTLEVLGIRPDGYHNLKSIVLPVSLHDDVVVNLGNLSGVRVLGCAEIPLEQNLAWKAAMALANYAGLISPQAEITLVKRIPAGAGLGGGSADAAAVIRGLNEVWRLFLPEADLLKVASMVGSDVPALLLGGPVLMEGRGERVRRLTAAELTQVPTAGEIELLTPPIFVSTAAVYREFRPEDCGQGRNDLQPAALRLFPDIAVALQELKEKGLDSVAMSGSGSTVYGVRHLSR